jgi:hypothetical protein
MINFIKKIVLGLLLLLIGLILYIFFVDYYPEYKFYSVQIPSEYQFQKPVEYLENRQEDSMKNLTILEEKIVVVGNGYNGYDFYIWHKPTDKGEIYIKAFELTSDAQLSVWKLTNRTKSKIVALSNKFKLYKGNTTIDEGTFENFYPVRFELWFKAKNGDKERKLTEAFYLIDGWDR